MVDSVHPSEEKEEVIDLLDIVEPQNEPPEGESSYDLSRGEDISCRGSVAEPVKTIFEDSDIQPEGPDQKDSEDKHSEENGGLVNTRESSPSEMDFVHQETKQEGEAVNVETPPEGMLGESREFTHLDDTLTSGNSEMLQKNLQDSSDVISNPVHTETEEDFEAFRIRCGRMLHDMEERLSEAEKARNELSARVEDLQQQLVDAGSMLLEDSGVRLQLEELVSRMLDVRSTQPDGENSSFLERLESLEKRVSLWEEQADQKMMSAAARVIREEVAAMRAESGSSGNV